MSDHQSNSNKNFWERVQKTETFQKLKNNTQKIKENYKDHTSKPSQDGNEKKLASFSTHTFDEEPLLSRSAYQQKMREKDQKENNLFSKASKPQAQSTSQISLLLQFDHFYGGLKRLFIMIIFALLLIGVIGFGVGYGYFVSLINQDMEWNQEELVEEVSSVASTSSMYYADGRKISDLRNDLSRTPIPIEEMSLNVLAAVISTEDNYFYDHDGIVPKAILRAVFEQITQTGGTGGSTLTQQLVKQQLLTDETTFERKANEIALSVKLEELLSKEEILEAYMNVSPFGRNNQGKNIAGVEEAAEGIFGVDAADLSLAQAAYLAGLPKSPIDYSPYDQNGQLKADLSPGIERQKDVLFFMFREGYLSEEEYQQAEAYDISQDFIASEPRQDAERTYLYDEIERRGRDIIINQLISADGKNPEEVKEDQSLYDDYYQRADAELRNGGYDIQTTIDRDLHLALNQTIEDNAWYIGSPRDVYWVDEESGQDQYMVDYAQNGSVLLDNESGRILAFIGGVNYEDNNVNHATQSRRSPASALKPLSVFGPALELGIITPASMVYDRAITFSAEQTGSGTYEPGNAGGFTNRWWNAREALAVSQNIPALRIYNEFYQDYDISTYFRNAGLGPEAVPDEDFNTLSLALGGVTKGTTVEEMTGLYAAIANDGQYVQPHMIESITNAEGETIFKAEDEIESHQVFEENTAYLLQDILRDVSTEGTGRQSRAELQFNLDLMSKTGTSDSYRDIWYIGSNPKITLGSWIGYSNIMATNDLVSEFGAYPSSRNMTIWSRLMNAIYYTNPDIMGLDEEFDRPAGIIEESVLAQTGMKPAEVDLPNGQTIQASGEMKEEIFLADHPPKATVYNFAVGGTPKELENFWSRFIRPKRRPQEETNESSDTGDGDEENSQEDEGELSDEDSSLLDDIIDGLRDQFTDQ